jgi:hypothetical protein
MSAERATRSRAPSCQILNAAFFMYASPPHLLRSDALHGIGQGLQAYFPGRIVLFPL